MEPLSNQDEKKNDISGYPQYVLLCVNTEDGQDYQEFQLDGLEESFYLVEEWAKLQHVYFHRMKMDSLHASFGDIEIEEEKLGVKDLTHEGIFLVCGFSEREVNEFPMLKLSADMETCSEGQMLAILTNQTLDLCDELLLDASLLESLEALYEDSEEFKVYYQHATSSSGPKFHCKPQIHHRLLIESFQSNVNNLFLLLRCDGIDVRVVDSSKRNLLHFVQNPHLLKIIAKCDGVSSLINEMDINGETPLFAAMKRRNYHVVQELLKFPNCDCNISDSEGFTTLNRAIYTDNIKIAELLLKHGANPMKPSKQRNLYPLQLAMLKGHSQIVPLLIELGADPNVSSEQFCSYHVIPNLELFFEESGSFFPLYNGIQSDEPECIAALIEAAGKKLDVNQTTNISLYTAVHCAVENGFYDVLKVLLESCETVDVNCQDVFGRTPAHIAKLRDDERMLQLLLKHGADFSIQDCRRLSVYNLNSFSRTHRLFGFPSKLSKGYYEGLGFAIAQVVKVTDSKTMKLVVDRVEQIGRNLPSIRFEGSEKHIFSPVRKVIVFHDHLVLLYSRAGNQLISFLTFMTQRSMNTVRQKLEVFLQCAVAMVILHRSKITHGGITKSTFTIEKDSKRLIIDEFNFLISQRDQHYGCPEVERTSKSDVYSWGKLMLETLVGHHWNDKIKRIQSSRSGLQIIPLLVQCLEPNPADRPDFVQIYSKLLQALKNVYEIDITNYKIMQKQNAANPEIVKKYSNEEISTTRSLANFEARLSTYQQLMDQYSFRKKSVFRRFETINKDGLLRFLNTTLKSEEIVVDSTELTNLTQFFQETSIDSTLQEKEKQWIDLIGSYMKQLSMKSKFCCLDMIRYLSLIPSIASYICNGTAHDILSQLFDILREWPKVDRLRYIAATLLCNLCNHPDTLACLLFQDRLRIIMDVLSADIGDEGKITGIPLSGLAYNLSIYFPNEIGELEQKKFLLACIKSVLSFKKLEKVMDSKKFKETLTYYCLTIYTLVQRSDSLKQYCQEEIKFNVDFDSVLGHSFAVALKACLLSNDQYYLKKS